jgi:hypothetical protein
MMTRLSIFEGIGAGVPNYSISPKFTDNFAFSATLKKISDYEGSNHRRRKGTFGEHIYLFEF